MLLLPHFLVGDARALAEENFELAGFGYGGYSTWPEAVQLLLLNYAKDRHIKAAIREFNNCTMLDSEDETAYGRRLQRFARLCGGVIDVQRLITQYCDGLPDYIQPSMLRILPTLPEFNRYQACVDEAATLGSAQRAVMQRTSHRLKPRGDRPRTTRVNQVAFQPLPHLQGRATLSSPMPATQSPTILNVEHYEVDEHSDSEGSFHTAAATLPSPFLNADPDSAIRGSVPQDEIMPVDALYTGQRGTPRYDRPYRDAQRDKPGDVCYTCYCTGHRAPNCPDAGRPLHDPHFQRRLYETYMKLTPPQRNHLQSVGRAPIVLHLAAIQQSSVQPDVSTTAANSTPRNQHATVANDPGDKSISPKN